MSGLHLYFITSNQKLLCQVTVRRTLLHCMSPILLIQLRGLQWFLDDCVLSKMPYFCLEVRYFFHIVSMHFIYKITKRLKVMNRKLEILALLQYQFNDDCLNAFKTKLKIARELSKCLIYQNSRYTCTQYVLVYQHKC